MQRVTRILALITVVTLASSAVRAQLSPVRTDVLAQCAPWSADATLSTGRYALSAATVGDLALFAGGMESTDPGTGAINTFPSDVVDIYDAAADEWSTASLSVPRELMAVAVLGDLVFFGGGFSGISSFESYAIVDIYDAAIGPPSDPGAWSTATLSLARSLFAATAVGNKVLFAGGVDSNGAVHDVVDIYDAALGPPSDQDAWSTTTLTRPRAWLAAATVGTEALFAGGYSGFDFSGDVVFNTVDIYDDATGQWHTAPLSQARALEAPASATVGSLAFFGGGATLGGPSDVVDIYDAETHTWSSTTLSAPRWHLAATAVEDTVYFGGGGEPDGSVLYDTVDRYDVTTGQWDSTLHLSDSRFVLDATTVDGKAIFAGGDSTGTYTPSCAVDIFEEPGPWADLGGGTAGVNGQPQLTLSGPLTPGSEVTLELTDAAPLELALLFVSFSSSPTPFLGGTLHSFPIDELVVVGTDGAGELHGSAYFPGAASGQGLWFQVGVADASVPVFGAALSNGVVGTAP